MRSALPSVQSLVRGLRMISVVLLLCTTGPVLAQVTFTTDTHIPTDDDQYDNQDLVVDGCTVTIDGAHAFASLELTNAGVLTHSGNTSEQVNTMSLTIAGDLTVPADCAINVNGRGYTSNNGPGAGPSAYYSAGAGHGGYGGNSSYLSLGGPACGDVLAPTTLGSGGGNGGAGGGAIMLDVAGTCAIDGIVSANGNTGSSHGGGGAGGSVYIIAGVLSGSGGITANGGDVSNANSGSGAGGRIAVVFGVSEFSGNMVVRCGNNGDHRGAAGTIYTRRSDESVGHVLVDNAGISGAWTPLTSPEEFALTIRNGAIAYPDEPLTLAELTVGANGRLTHRSAVEAGTEVHVVGDASVAVDGSIDVSGLGHGASSGPGAGSADYYSAGAGHGGYGAGSSYITFGGPAYGDVLAPTALGSGGGSGGAGGGAIRLTVGSTLNVEGQILANGATAGGHGGGGSGGSIYITADAITGAGTISAVGGNVSNANAGCGAGGRIAIEYGSYNFAGSTTARGGSNGEHRGAAGTIYLKPDADDVGHVSVDNNGINGAWTPLTTPRGFRPHRAEQRYRVSR